MLSKEDLDQLDNYFMKNIGLDCNQIIGAELKLKIDLLALLYLTPERHYTVKKNVGIRKDCEVKIISFDFQPLGYSNYFIITIVNSQILFDKDDKLQVSLKKLIKAVK